MISSDSINKINQALANSFANIKQDMNEIKDVIRSQNKEFVTLQSDVSHLKSETVNKEKVEFIRLKVGELNENLKKIWDLEKGLKGVSERSVNRIEFEQSVDELKSKIGQVNFRLGELGRNYVTENQVKDAIGSINQEFINVQQMIREAKSAKVGISMSDLEHHTSKITKKVDSFDKDFSKLKTVAQDFMTEDQVRFILDDANKELDSIRRELAVLEKRSHGFAVEAKIKTWIDGLRKNVEKVDERSHGYVTESEVAQVVDDINKGFENVKEKLKAVERDNKTNVKDHEVKTVIDEINKEFTTFKRELTKIKDRSQEYVDMFKLHGAVEKLHNEIDSVKKETKNFVTDVQVKGLVNDINKELASFKDELSYVTELELDMKAIDKVYAKKLDANQLSEKIEDVRREYTKKHDAEKLAVHIAEVEAAVRRIHSDFAENKKVDKVEKELEVVRKELKKLKSDFVSRKEYGQELQLLNNELNDINGRSIIKELKPTKTIKNLKKKQKFRGTFFLANFLIVFAFLTLIFSVVSFIVGEISLMDKTAIGSVIMFVIGIVIRSIVVTKRKNI